MLKNSLFRKCISFVLTIALFTSVVAPASAAVADMFSKSSYNAYYVALGDAVTEGYGLDDPDDVYYVRVAEALGKSDDYYAYSHNKLRVEEIRYLLDDGYNGDGYTSAIGSMLKHKRTEVQGYVSNAEVITINAGVRNFSTYIVEQMVHYLENNGAVKYNYSFDAFYDEKVQDALYDIKNVVTEQFAAIAPDEGVKALEFANFVVEVSTYAVMSYITSFNGMIASTYKLNPDVDLYVIGIYNPMQDEVLSFSNGETTKDIPLGTFFGALVELANAYAQILAPRAYDYTYVDPGNPELLIDQMGNNKLTDEERFPNGLMAELLDLAGDAALEEVVDIFTEYEIDPSPLTMEAYAERFLDELAYITDEEERIDYIRGEIEFQANKKVREAFKDELKKYLGQFANGDKVITDTQVDDLLTDLGAAAATPCADGKCEACRECIAKDFVETLINNPELQTQAAAKLIYNKLENYGLKDCVTLAEVEQMLKDMNACGEDEAARKAVVVAFVHDLAAAKVTLYVQEIVGEKNYTEAKADAMLTAMETAANKEAAAAIAKEALWKDAFRQYMIDKIKAKFDDLGLEWVNTSAEKFVDDIYAAGDDYEAVVRATILASGAAEVSDVSFGIYSTNEVITLFSAMDAKATEAEKKSYLEANLRAKFYSLYSVELFNKFWDAYTSYVDAANTSIKLVGQYLDGVEQAADALAEYKDIQNTVVVDILRMYKENYKDGSLDLGSLLEGDDGLKELQDLRKAAVEAILDGYNAYEDAMDTAMKGAEQINNELTPVYNMLKQIAEVEKISLNDLLALGEKVVGDESYVVDMANRLVLDKTLNPEETTAAYIALRYFIGNGMMIMPSANGHQTIANQIIKGINGEPTGSTAGILANKVIDGAVDIYHCAKKFLKQPTSASGQVGTLINPDTYIAFGDHVTLGTALDKGEKTYVDLLADALAMEYKDTANFDNDTVLNLSFGGMRAEELHALVASNYNGDAYTGVRYSDEYIEGLRAKYQQHIKNADLITVNVGINNLVTYPLMQSYLAYNGQETYEMDWAYYFGQHRVDKVAKGKTAINKLLMHAVDVADNHIPDVDGFSAYEKCETLLTTVATACESLAYGLLGYIVNLDAAVEAIASANPDATIVLVGFYNPMEDTYIHVENVTLNGHVVDLSKHTPINTSALTEKVINIANRVLTNYVGFYADDLVASGEGSRIVTVPILDTELCISDTNAVKDLSTLADWTTVSGLGHEVTIKIPQYFLETRKTLGAALHPNANGHEYIFNQILKSLKYEIHADVVPENNEKYYGDADPELYFNWDDASSLFEGGTVVKVSREPGEDVGEYKIIVTVEKNGGYHEIELDEAVFTIKARPITVEVQGSTTIVTGDEVPEFTVVIKDVLTGNEIPNDGIVKITGIPENTNTAEEYTVSAELINNNYAIQSCTDATLTIEDKIVVDVTLDGKFSGVYGDDHSNDLHVVYKVGDQVIENPGFTATVEMPEATANVGKYQVEPKISGTVHGYVLGTVTKVDYEITARPINVVVNEDKTIFVGEAIPGFSVVVTDKETGADLSANIVEISGVPANSATAGTYTITAILKDTNYVIDSCTNATLTIVENNVLNITLGGALTGVYGEEHTGVVVLVNGQPNTLAGLDITVNGIPAKNANVGTYTLTIDVNSVPRGYVIGNVTNASYEVTARPINVVVKDNATIYVGEAIPGFSAVVTDKETGADLSANIVEISGVPANSNVAGTYTITAKLVNNNYKIASCTDATLTIVEKTEIEITLGGIVTGTYGNDHSGDLHVIYKVNGQIVANPGFNVTFTAPAKDAEVGSYEVKPVVSGTIPAGYKYVITPVDYTVVVRTVSVVVNEDKTILVGDVIPGFTAVVTDDITSEVINGTGIVAITGVPASSNTAGKYTISASSVNRNYAISFCTDATLTIKDEVIVTVGGTMSGVYGDVHGSDLEVVVTVNGQVVTNHGLNVTITGTPAQNAAAGDYDIIPVVSGVVPENYDVTVDPEVYTVTKRPITVNVTVLDGNTILNTVVTAGSMVNNETTDVLNLAAANGEVTYSNDNYDVTINVIPVTSRNVYIKIQPSEGSFYYGDVIRPTYVVLDPVTSEVVNVDLQAVLDTAQINTSILGDHVVKVVSYVPVVGYNVADITASDATIRVEARPIKVKVTVVDGVITDVVLTNGTLASWDAVDGMDAEDWINLLGLTVNDEKTAVSSSNANYNVTIEADFQSSYVPDYVCWNTTTGKKYEIVHLAVLEAKKGETIQMLKDSDQTVLTNIYHYAGSVNLINGVTLDLQGYTLKLDSLIGTEGSYLTGTYYNGTNGGKLVVPAKNFVLKSTADGQAANAKVLPAWVAEEGAYVFGQYLLLNGSNMNLTVDTANDTLHFAFDHNASKWIRANVMNDGVTDNRMSVEVYLQWETDTGVAYQHFVYTDEQVAKSNGVFDAEGNQVSDSFRYYFSLSAYSDLEINLDTLVVTARIISDCGASIEGTSYKVSGVVSDSTDDNTQVTTPVEYEFVTSTGMVCENVNTGAQYAILHDAILEASEGDVIRMIANSDQTQLKDICPSAGIVTLTNGIVLDLQGYALKVDVLFAAEGSYVTADYYNGSTGGKLVVSEKNLILHDQGEGTAAGASELPAWDPNLGCYVFGQFLLLDKGSNLGLEVHKAEDYIYFRFDHNASSWFRGNILNNGVTENDMAVEVYLQWQTETGVAYQYFVYTDEQVDKSNGVFNGSTMVEDNYRYYFTLNGIEQLEIDLDTLVVSARIISNCGSTAQGSEHRP